MQNHFRRRVAAPFDVRCRFDLNFQNPGGFGRKGSAANQAAAPQRTMAGKYRADAAVWLLATLTR